ncbi:MAG: hypothetical protein M1832_003836 [Thelocarpon impressellum]|nr:MAG: hypothetical protein M1832_003836 [Thelocarpon impressellum]
MTAHNPVWRRFGGAGGFGLVKNPTPTTTTTAQTVSGPAAASAAVISTISTISAAGIVGPPSPTPDGQDLARFWHNPVPFYVALLEWLTSPVHAYAAPIMLLVQTLLTCGALAWLLHRVWQTFSKPLPELISILGLEVPVAPEVSLAGIKSDAITLHWTRPPGQGQSVKYYIQVNGVNVGESSRLETAITVAGLRPDNFYSVRIVASNAMNFRASSRVIRLKTKRATSKPEDATPPSSAAGATLPDAISAPSGAVVTAQEYSGASPQSRRLATNGKPSAAVAAEDSKPSEGGVVLGDFPNDPSECDASVRRMTEKLETLRVETDDLQRQMEKEEQEFEAARSALIKERDGLRQALKEKDDASAELRKEVANLDRQNRSAQSRKSAKEKMLQQKIDERTKMRQDIVKWEKEIGEMDKEIERWAKEKKETAKASDEKAKEVRQQISDSQTAVKALEEDIKTKGVQIKALEEERKKLQTTTEDGEWRDHAKAAEEEEAKWELRLRELQLNYAKTVHSIQQAQENHRQAQERLGWWNSRGITHPSDFSRLTALDFDLSGSKKGKQRRGRNRKSRTNTVSSLSNGSYPADPRTQHLNTSSPSVAPAPLTPFFNMGNGASVPAASDQTTFSQAEVDQLTGGAPMSPTANSLLPADLLGDEDLEARPISSLGGLPIGPAFGGNAFTSLGAPGPSFDAFGHDLNSPASSGSRSASVFSSPRGSLNNLSIYPSAPDSLVDVERQSMHGSAASLGAIGLESDGTPSSSRRFASLFSLNLNRQRGKTLGGEPPSLGSLKSSQSQSFPVDLEQPGELDPIGTKRRKGIHSSSWVSPMSNFNFLGRNPASPDSASEGNAPAPVRNVGSRRKPFNMFSSKYDPLDPSKILGDAPAPAPAPPRPLSISSFENALPRPSSDAQPFGWPTAEGAGHRSSPLGADWSVRSGEPWSRGPSRRGSIKRGSSTSLALGPTPFEEENLHALLAKHAALPTPIGTRPDTAEAASPPKLNPAAPTFKTIFSRSDAKKAERAEKAEKAAEAAAEREKQKDLEWLREDSSPIETRRSRDNRSVETEESTAESRDSLDHSISGTASESTPSAVGGRDKPSIFQKITRKSSSSKFNIPWKDKAGLFSKRGPTEPPTPGEMDEAGSGESVFGKSVESVTSSPNLAAGSSGSGGLVGVVGSVGSGGGSGGGSGVGGAGSGSGSGSLGRSSLSWSALRRRPKREGKAASEASERASETGDDEEVDHP